MQSINETNFENNTDIKQFMASSNPTVDMIVKAYIARDTVMNISFDKQKNLKKLGYTTNAITTHIQYKFKMNMSRIIDKFLLNTLDTSEYNLTTEYDKMVNSDEIVRYIESHETRFSELNSIDNYIEFYQKLTHGELMCLGW
jgi:hypothetical protein